MIWLSTGYIWLSNGYIWLSNGYIYGYIWLSNGHDVVIKQCHKLSMTGNGKFIAPIKMVMTGGW